jgi:TatD DNase family protein
MSESDGASVSGTSDLSDRLIDTHAHVDAAGGVAVLKHADSTAHVIAVTNLPRNYVRLRHLQHDRLTWALGLHPGQPHTHSAVDEFLEQLPNCTVVGEIGLDGTTATAPGGVPMTRQRDELERILNHPETRRRLVTLHSRRSVPAVLQHLAAANHPAPVLHWFTGTSAQAHKAADAGAYFSVNDRMQRKSDLLSALPRDRVLLETDAPYTGKPGVPGAVDPAVAMLASHWNCSATQVEDQVKGNQHRLIATLDIHPMRR